MAMHADEDPIRAEALRLLDEIPGLEAEVVDFARRVDRDEIAEGELHSTPDVRARLRRVNPTRDPQ